MRETLLTADMIPLCTGEVPCAETRCGHDCGAVRLRRLLSTRFQRAAGELLARQGAFVVSVQLMPFLVPTFIDSNSSFSRSAVAHRFCNTRSQN